MWQKIINTPWHLMRWIRLGTGILAITNFCREWNGANTSKMNYVILAAGIYFIYKALFNTGCEVQNNYTPDHTEDETTTVDYEEIK